MREVTILWDESDYTYDWLSALFWAKQEFRELGYSIKLFAPQKNISMLSRQDEGSKKLFLEYLNENSFDIVFCAFHDIGLLGSYKNNMEILPVLKEKTEVLVWLDTADSTGTPQFAVLPYVDVYLKKQLLKDRETYYNRFWGERIYTDYYHREFDYEDDDLERVTRDVLLPKYSGKLGLSWNLGLTGQLIELAEKNNGDIIKINERDMPIHYRGSDTSYQRVVIKKALKELPEYGDNLEGKVEKSVFLEELRNSRIVISPYGWGEICFRDFEGFIFGNLLLKPQMNHLETYPQWYSDDTYVSFKWDFSDFIDKIEEILNCKNTKMVEEISENARMKYLKYCLEEKGKYEFASHLIGEIERISANKNK